MSVFKFVFYKIEFVFLGSSMLFTKSIAFTARFVSSQLLIHNQKMELTKFEIRVLLKHNWKQDYKAAATARRICEVEGEGVVSEHVTQRWCQRFNSGEDNTKDLLRSRRPKLWDI